jgi:hypothetical protein
MINNYNHSEVWGGFRVAKRAKIINIKENINFVKATHDGYKSNFGILHTRSFTAFEDKIVIEDFIDGNLENTVVTAYLHFYPGIVPIIKGQEVYVKDVKINIDSDNIAIHKYKYAPEFNKLITAYFLEIKLTKKLKMELII